MAINYLNILLFIYYSKIQHRVLVITNESISQRKHMSTPTKLLQHQRNYKSTQTEFLVRNNVSISQPQRNCQLTPTEIKVNANRSIQLRKWELIPTLLQVNKHETINQLLRN